MMVKQLMQLISALISRPPPPASRGPKRKFVVFFHQDVTLFPGQA
jgi:hypothetical protein